MPSPARSASRCSITCLPLPCRTAFFSEVRRVVRPGGTFAGTDSTGRGIGFALLHVGDAKVVVDPERLPARLQAAGFEQARVDWGADALRFRAS